MPQDMSDGKIICDRIARVGQRHVNQLKRHMLRVGDVVYSRRGDVTRFAVVTKAEEGWLCGTGSIRIRLNCPEIEIGYVRRYLQQVMVHWLYKHDAALKLPYKDNLSALIHEPTFKTTAGAAVFAKTVLINRLGNSAVHGHRPVQQFDALTAVRELFHVAYWLAHTYACGAKPAPGLAFDPNALPKTMPLPKQTIEQLQRLETNCASGTKSCRLYWRTRRRWMPS